MYFQTNKHLDPEEKSIEYLLKIRELRREKNIWLES